MNPSGFYFFPAPHRLGSSFFFSSPRRQPLQRALHGESLRPPGQGLPVSPHVEAPPQRSSHHGADASKRRGSLGLHQVNARPPLPAPLCWPSLSTVVNQDNNCIWLPVSIFHSKLDKKSSEKHQERDQTFISSGIHKKSQNE